MVLKHAAALALGACVLPAAIAAQTARFEPPRLLKAALPPLPGPNIAGGGEVLIEGIVDRRGVLTRPRTLRATPPYTEFILEAIEHWQFEPARDIDYRGVATTVEMPVTIVAIYRPPVLMNAPTIGEPPRDLMKASGDVAMATSTAMPSYPPRAFSGGVVLYEIALDEGGRVTATRDIDAAGGFQSAAREALTHFRFRPASFRAKAVPGTTYVVFGFRVPVGLVSSPVP